MGSRDYQSDRTSPTSGPARPGQTRVLHVDDDVGLLDLTADVLQEQRESLSVTTESNPEAAVELLAADPTRVDCVLSDYDMPRLNGLEFYEALEERGITVPFILYTGKGSEAIASQALSTGVTDYIQKQTGTDHLAVLAKRLEEAADSHHSERRLSRSRDEYRRLLDSAPSPVTVYDEDGLFLYVNQAATSFLEADSQEALLDCSKFDFIEPTESESIRRRLRRLANGETIPTAEHTYQCLDGSHKRGVASCGPAPFNERAAGISVIRETDATDGT